MVDSWVARWNFGGKPVYLEKTVQRYVNETGFCKFFGEKMQKTLIMQCSDNKIGSFLRS